MILSFVSPIRALQPQELREALVAFALLQQTRTGRAPLHICAPAPSDHDEEGSTTAPVQAHDLLRCMVSNTGVKLFYVAIVGCLRGCK